MNQLLISVVLTIVVASGATQHTNACLGQQTWSQNNQQRALQPGFATASIVINIVNQGTVNIFIPSGILNQAPEAIASAVSQQHPEVRQRDQTQSQTMPSRASANAQASHDLFASPSLEVTKDGLAIRGWDVVKTFELLSLIARYTFKTAVQVAYIIGDMSYTYLFPTIKVALYMLFKGIGIAAKAFDPSQLFSALGTPVYAQDLGVYQSDSRELVNYNNGPTIEELSSDAILPVGMEVGFPTSIQEVD